MRALGPGERVHHVLIARELATSVYMCSRKDVRMIRRVLALAFVVVLGSTAALAQVVPLPLTSTPAWRAAFLSLDTVQAQVDATLKHAAASKLLIDVALAATPPALLSSTPIPRR
jgi:hypothetical protein